MQEIKNKPTLELPKDEMAFRRTYRALLENEDITTVFRPGQRDCGRWRGYCPGQIVTARVIEEPGLDRAMVPPKFISGVEKIIMIESLEVKKIRELVAKDFHGSSPDIRSIEQLRWHLGVIYNLDLSDLTDDAEVTKITFSYQQRNGV